MKETEIMTIEEVARLLRVSERTVYEWAQKGEIPAGKLGSSWRFKRAEVERWVDDRLGRKPIQHPPYPVRISEILRPERIILTDAGDKAAALESLIGAMAGSPGIRSRDDLRAAIFSREELMSTGIGCGVGVPHARLETVSSLTMAMAVNARPLPDYTSLDSLPVRIICMIAAEKGRHASYLQTLSALGSRLREKETREEILAAKTPETVFAVMTRDEAN